MIHFLLNFEKEQKKLKLSLDYVVSLSLRIEALIMTFSCSQTELLLDVIGDEEPICVRLDQIKSEPESDTEFQETIESDTETKTHLNQTVHIKCEEFDVDEFLSSQMDEPSCPTSPESQPASPIKSEISNDFNDSIELCTNNDTSMVGNSTNNGSHVNEFIDDEFILSCGPETINNSGCNMVDMDDPFSELFPSLISV